MENSKKTWTKTCKRQKRRSGREINRVGTTTYPLESIGKKNHNKSKWNEYIGRWIPKTYE
jgi:hypothetical protein